MFYRKSNFLLFIILLQFLSLGLCYSYYLPLWSPPDEERHFAYCEYIAQNHRLPAYNPGSSENSVSMAFHPPLYYLAGALFCSNDGRLLEEEISINDGPGYNRIASPQKSAAFPYSGKVKSAHLLRIFSIALSSVNIYFIFLLVLRIFPGEPIFAAATSLFVATIPEFLHVSASVSNENMSTALSTAYLLVLLRYLQGPVKAAHHLIAGVVLGCCLLSKTMAVFYLPVTLCVITFVYWRDWRSLIRNILIVMCTSFLVAGWWYLRNWFVSQDLFLTKTVIITYPWFLRADPLSLNEVIMGIGKTFASFFGTLHVPLPGLHLAVYVGLLLFGLAGLCRLPVKKGLTSLQRKALGMLLLAFLGAAGIFVLLNNKYTGMFLGRYLFVVIAPAAIITFSGLRSLLAPHRRNPCFIMISFLLIILSLDAFFRILLPAYAEVNITEEVDQPMFCCPTPPINVHTSIGQTFVAPQDNLCAIRVMFSSEGSHQDGAISFILKEAGNNGAVLYRIDYPYKKIKDFMRYFFIFRPIKNSRGKEYLFSFSCTSESEKKKVSLWHTSQDFYPGGQMYINGKPSDGDLYFTAYFFTGKYPKTAWEGTKQTVIPQGIYVTIREIQLYQERSRQFRAKTITHQKLLRLSMAVSKRKSLSKP